MTCVIDERLKEAAEETEWKKALKDVAIATAEKRGRAAEVSEWKAQAVEKARLTAESKLTDMGDKLGKTKIKLAKADS